MNNPKRLEEAYSSALHLLTFLVQRGSLASPAQFREALDRAYAARSLRALRAAIADLQQRTQSLPPAEREELARDFPKDPVQEILDRGKIRTEDEYRLILSCVEEIAGSDRNDHIDRLNALLDEAYDRLSSR